MKSIILSKVKKDKMQKTRLYYSLYKKVMKSKETEKVRSCLRKKMGIEIICEFPKSDRNTELVTVKMNKVVKNHCNTFPIFLLSRKNLFFFVESDLAY